MRDSEMSQKIRERIIASQRSYKPDEQKAELLLRNLQFLDERTRAGSASRQGVTIKFNARWQNFNYRWGIDGWWDGSDATLHEHVIMEPRIYYRDPKSGIVWIHGRDLEHPYACDQRSEKLALNIADAGAFIYIKINPWTLKDDLRNLEPTIRKLREELFCYSERDFENFGRDVCWYDLHE
jgi:hypothetical protein